MLGGGSEVRTIFWEFTTTYDSDLCTPIPLVFHGFICSHETVESTIIYHHNFLELSITVLLSRRLIRRHHFRLLVLTKKFPEYKKAQTLLAERNSVLPKSPEGYKRELYLLQWI